MQKDYFRILLLQIEKIHPVTYRVPVEHTVLDHENVESIGEGVNSGGPHATASRFSTDNDGPDTTSDK